MRYVIGIDIGTTSMKAAIISDAGQVIAQAVASQHLISRYPAWAEEDPNEWWKSVTLLVADCLTQSGMTKADIRGIGVSGMVPALLVLDDNGIPERLSIQQNDARTAREIEEMKSLIGDDYAYELTGSSITQQSIGPKLLWLRKYEPEVMRNAHAILGSYDYINFKLTGVLGVERNWALESGLYDPRHGVWAENILAALQIEPSLLPEIRAPQDFLGTVTPRAAAETGLQEGTPVVAGCADHVASTFAAGVVHEGELNIKFGGAGDILYCSKNFMTNPRLFVDYHLVPEMYLLNGCMASSGSLIKWFVDQFCQVEKRSDQEGETPYKHLDTEAASLSTSVIVLPYFIGEKTPIMDPQARGVIFGLGLNHSKVHIYRAILEAVAFGFRHHLDVMRESGCLPTKVVATDGGSRSSLWRQISSDVLGLPVHSISNHIGSTLGAAFAAGIAVGIYSSWEDIKLFVEIIDTMEPDPVAQVRYTEKYHIYRALYDKLRDEFPRLNKLESIGGESPTETVCPIT